MNKNKFQENLRKSREELGLTGQEMAKILNIPATTYRGYENSNRQPDFETLLKISDILKVPVDALLRDYNKTARKPGNTKKIFSNKLRLARERRNYSPETLGAKIGVDASLINEWESATIEPDLTNLLMLSYTLDVSLDTLLGINRKSSESITEIVRMLEALDEDQLESFHAFLETLIKK